MIELDDGTLAVHVWLDHHSRYVVRLEAGWTGPRRKSSGKPKPPETLALAEAFAVVQAGRMILPNGPELARIKRLLLVDGGRLAPTPITTEILPTTAPESALRVYEVTSLAEHPPDDPSRSRARSLNRGADSPREPRVMAAPGPRNRFITWVAEEPSGFGEPTKLWLLGDRPDPRWHGHQHGQT